jgi:hypothetical protein
MNSSRKAKKHLTFHPGIKNSSPLKFSHVPLKSPFRNCRPPLTISKFRSRNMGLSRARARPAGACEVRRWHRAATPIKGMGHAGAAPVISPIIIVWMRPDVWRDLALSLSVFRTDHISSRQFR